MELVNITRAGLIDYTAAQVRNFFPDGRDNIRARIESHCDEALSRMNRCINGVRIWPENKFNYLHSSQYCIYLYYLYHSIWKATGDIETCTKLFALNKALNAIDCFYEIDLPEVFFIGHSVGIVLAKATYSNHLVLYQNSTVGKNHGIAPVIGEGVIMYPNTAIIGRCNIGDRTVISQGTGIINRDTPGNVMAFSGVGSDLVLKPLQKNILADIFRI